jgi:5'-deoxynucleotidase YfbR-like HD superfamily hydrolase
MNRFIQKIESLDNIRQWEERDSVIKESVSQHSFKVASIAYFILNRINNGSSNLSAKVDFLAFKFDVLSYAIMHDFDEAILGRDISHTVKYNAHNGECIRESLNEFVEHELSVKFGKIIPTPSNEAKTFVKLCDWIALLTFIKRNKKMGCVTFEQEEQYCLKSMYNKLQEVNKLLEENFGIEKIDNIVKIF